MPSERTLTPTKTDDLLKMILEKVSTTLAYVRKIEEQLGTVSVMGPNGTVNDDLLQMFPMKDVNSLEIVDMKLLDTEFEIQMVILYKFKLY